MDFSLAKMGSALAIGLFFLMMLSVEVGRRIGRYRYATDKDSFSEGLGAAEGWQEAECSRRAARNCKISAA